MTPQKPLYSPLVVAAFEHAAVWHAGQVRKHPAREIPYIAHPAMVALMLERAGCDDETIAAGVLHDVMEDCGATQDEIANITTPRVAELVAAVTEWPDISWDARKAAYRTALALAPREALLIAAADHLANNQSIVQMAQQHQNVWRIFHGSREKRLHHEEAVLILIRERLSHPIVEELAESLNLLKHLP